MVDDTAFEYTIDDEFLYELLYVRSPLSRFYCQLDQSWICFVRTINHFWGVTIHYVHRLIDTLECFDYQQPVYFPYTYLYVYFSRHRTSIVIGFADDIGAFIASRICHYKCQIFFIASFSYNIRFYDDIVSLTLPCAFTCLVYNFTKVLPIR